MCIPVFGNSSNLLSKLCELIFCVLDLVLKNKQNGESDNKSEKKNQKNGDSSVDKSDKKNQCKEIVLKVYMHCEGCASQVSHCLRGYDGNTLLKETLLDYFPSLMESYIYGLNHYI